jgi:uncharacterized protein DUF4760
MPRNTTRRLSSSTSKAFKAKRTVKAASSVTKDDIDVMLKLADLYNTSYDFDAAEWFWDQFKKPITFEEFRNKYPQGSKGAQLFERFTSKLELAGTLIEYGFLNENLYFDRYGSAQAEWESAKPVIYGIRKEWNEPRFRENFEILATRGMKWMESHPPKINNI